MNDRTGLRIIDSKRTRLSRWVTLVENVVSSSSQLDGHSYHALELSDYVSILAVTADNRIPLVRQFRPAVNQTTLELPGGLLDSGEVPLDCARRELAEETGLAANDVQELATFFPDTGRLSNRMHAFFARDAHALANWKAEEDVAVEFVDKNALLGHALNGVIANGPHLSMILIAAMRGLI